MPDPCPIRARSNLPAGALAGVRYNGHMASKAVRQAVEEVRAVADRSRARLHKAYDEHVQDLEVLTQLSAYAEKYDQWAGVRNGDPVPEVLWGVG